VKSAASLPLSEPASIQWRLTSLYLSPKLTWPPRDFLTTWDVRVRRLTLPFWRPPSLLSPLQESLSRRPARVHRGVQCRHSTSDQATQSSRQWESSSDDEADPSHSKESRGTQVEAPIYVERQTQTGNSERSYTSPGTPPKLRLWGP